MESALSALLIIVMSIGPQYDIRCETWSKTQVICQVNDNVVIRCTRETSKLRPDGPKEHTQVCTMVAP